MRTLVSYCIVAASVGVLSFFGCSSKDSSNASTTSAGGGFETSTTAASMPTSTGTKGSTGPGPTTTTGVTSGAGGGSCQGVLGGGCGMCSETNCCNETAACAGDANCSQCLSASPPMECATDTLLTDLNTCLAMNCQAQCFPDQCNPVTNEGCANDGSTCDLSSPGGNFGCFAPPNDVKLCGKCDNNNGPYCGPGLHCSGGFCGQYCCDDGDCGTGKCNLMALAPSGFTVGVCEGGSDTDAGADAGTMAPSCDAPAMPPSKGACFSFGQGGGPADAGAD